MSDPTRKDGGVGPDQLFVSIAVDSATSNVTVETNIHNAAVMLRVLGQAMHVWADDLMRKGLEAAQRRVHLPTLVPPRKM